MLCRGIDSLIENAKDLSNIEFIFRFDDDDEDTINQVVDYYDCKVVTIINISNELKGLKKLNKSTSSDLTTRMKHVITSVNGDYEKKTIREFVDNNLLAIDARALRNHIKDIQPDVDLKYNYEDNRGRVKAINIPVGINFFWPDVTI